VIPFFFLLAGAFLVILWMKMESGKRWQRDGDMVHQGICPQCKKPTAFKVQVGGVLCLGCNTFTYTGGL
jgi:hypothetical protein